MESGTIDRPTPVTPDEAPSPAMLRLRRGKARRDRMVTACLSAAFFVVIMAVWTAVVEVFDIKAYLLPLPADIASAIWNDLGSGSFWTENFLTTLTEVLAGFGLAVGVSLILGPLMLAHPLVERTLYPYVVAIETVPKIALAPLLLIWMGYGTQSKIVIAGLVAFFPMLVNVIAGLKATDENQLQLMRSLRAGWWTRLIKLRLPAAIPFILAGLNIAMVFSVIGAIVAEFLGSANGLGSLVLQRQRTVDVSGVFSVLVFLSLMGTALFLVLRLLSRRFAFWAEPVDGERS